MSTFYIGLKMGSTNTCIYKAGNGIVLKEPSLIAVPSNPKLKEVKAFGFEAKKLIGKKSDNISILTPITEGIIRYEELAAMMLKCFLKKVFPDRMLGQNIKAVVTIPLGLTPQEKKQYEIVCYKAGIADVYLVPDVICQALGSGIDITGNKAQMIVNIGGDTTNIAIISNLTVIDGINISIGGNIINIAIKKYIEETYNFSITLDQAEKLKYEICSLFANYTASKEFIGLNMKTLEKEKLVITGEELYPIIKNYYLKFADSINAMIQGTSPEVLADISKSGIYFYGDATLIVGLEKFMTQATGFKTKIVEVPKANLLGTSELIKNPHLLKKTLKNN